MWVKVLGNVAVIIVQWEGEEVLSHGTESKSSLLPKSSPELWWGLVHLPPSCPNLKHDSCVLFHRLLPEAGCLPLGRLCLPCKLWLLGLHVLGETKAKAGMAVLSEWFPRPRSCCALMQPLHLGAVMVVTDTHEKEKQKVGSEKGECAGAAGRHGEGRVCRCSSFCCALIYSPGSSLNAETWLFGNRPKALMKAGGEVQHVPGSQEPFVSQSYRLSLRRHIITQPCAG